MATQIKKFGLPMLSIAGLAALILIPLAQSDPPPGDGDPQTAQALRAAIGFGPLDALPALAGDNSHRQLINQARSFVANYETELAPLVTNLRDARKELARCLSWGEDPTAARQALQDAREAMVAAISNLVPDLMAHIPPQHQQLVARAFQNRRLDPDLRLLNLTDQQRTALLAAKQERDAVLKNARNWHNQPKNEQANAAFSAALDEILTAQQKSQLANIRQVLQNRLLEMATAEAEAFEGA